MRRWYPPVLPLGPTYHVDPVLLAIQIPEFVGADVNQGAQVPVIGAAGNICRLRIGNVATHLVDQLVHFGD